MQKIIITTKEKKKKQLKEKNPFDNIKIMTLKELEAIYPYKYTEKTLDYIITNYHVLLDIAKIYLEQIIKYPVEKITGEKGEFLTKLKKELINQNLLEPNELLKEELKKKEILIYLPKTKHLENWLEPFSIKFEKSTTENYSPKIYELETLEDEVLFLSEQIHKLLTNHILPEQIKLTNLKSDYYPAIERIFKLQHIPVNLSNDPTLNQTHIGNTFLNNLKTMSPKEALIELEPLLTTEDTITIYNQIIEIANKYIHLKNASMFITNELSTTKRKKQKNKNAIEEVQFDELEPEKDTYIFLLSCNNDFPTIYKDENYLPDKVLRSINEDTTTEKNKLSKTIALEKIKSCQHMTIIYKRTKNGSECYPSPLLKYLEEPSHPELKWNTSHLLNQIYLGIETDEYVKYNTTSKNLEFLKTHYQIPYQTYDNNYSKIPTNTLHTYLKELKLSYTSIDIYNKCPFRYFITYILKIIPYESTFTLFIGNLFHKILEHKDTENWESLYDELSTDFEANWKEKYFLEKLKPELKNILDTINTQESEMDLPYETFETELYSKIPSYLPSTFEGRIDKIKYQKTKENTIVCLIDYKTGSTKILKELIPLGFSLQLPLYLYLIKHTEQFKSASVGGIYFQNILPNRINRNDKKTYEMQKKDVLKLQVYSNRNQKILQYVDKNYNDSKIINGLKTKSDGEFYQYAKVLDESDMDTLTSVAKNFIEKDALEIQNGEFPMTSKIIDNKTNISCEYCKLKDICYHTNKQNVYLTSDKNFLKKEETKQELYN